MIVSLMTLHFIAAAGSAPAVPAPPDTPAPVVAPGTRVRVKAAAGKWRGRIVDADGEGLSLVPDDAVAPIRLRLADVQRLEVSRGRMSAGEAALEKGSIGMFIGVGVGGLLGLGATNSAPHCLVICDSASSVAAGAMVAGAAGGLIGALVGAASPPERWRRVEGLRTQVVLLPRRGGMGAALRLSF